MSSPIHRALFSPPTSPNQSSSPIIDAVRDYLLPSPSGMDSEKSTYLSPSNKQSGTGTKPKLASTPSTAEDLVAQFGPGGFNSTRAYPSRNSRTTRPKTPEPIPVPTFNFNVDDSATRVTLSSSTFSGSDSPSLKQRSSFSGPSVVSNASSKTTPGPSESDDPFIVAPRSSLISLRALGVQRSTSRSIVLLLLALAFLGVVYNREDGILDLLLGAKSANLQDRSNTTGVGMDRVLVKGNAGAPKMLDYHKLHKIPAVAHPKTQQRPSTTPLTPSRELLALQSYLIADPAHVLPADLPLDEPLDSMILLDFLSTDEASWMELEEEVDPVVVWTSGKTWNDHILDLLEIYSILPAAKVISLDGRSDLSTIQRTLSRLIPGRPQNARELPLVTIGGKPVPTYQDLVKLHETGELHSLIEAAGAVVDGQRAVDDEEESRRSRGRPLKHAKGLHRRR